LKRFENILCVIEPDDSSNAAVIKAMTLAKNHQAKLCFVTIINKTGIIRSIGKNAANIQETLDEISRNKQHELKVFVHKYSQEIAVDIKILVGINFIEVIHEVLREDHDLVVKCCANPSWIERIFGSNDMQLLRKCPCPVLMLRSEQVKPCINILATVDLADDDNSKAQGQLNQKVMEYSIAVSLVDSANLHIGSIWNAYGEDHLRYSGFSHAPDDDIDTYVEKSKKEFTDKFDVFMHGSISKYGKEIKQYIQPKTHLVKGEADKEIPLMIKEHAIDLVVLGTVSRTGIPGLIIGNTAESILEQVQCSVLAIKPDGFQTTVTL